MDVFLVLGAAVVKSALKIWLRDESFASDASASVVDLLQAKMSGDLEQRRARRFFEDLEVPVSKRLRAMRQAEFSQLPENEWTAAVHAAGDSFDRARLTAKDLFTRDLDPLFLERQIRRGSGTDTRDLSAAGVALYDRLISEGCAQVIKIADKLPHFQVGAFAELLHRSSQMVELIGEALDRIPARAEGESPEAKFETNYRRHLAKKMDRLELFGLDFESPSQPLSVAYVSLRTGGQGSGGGQSIEDRLASPRTLLVGRAGSGKTTVLQWLAMQAALKDFTGPLAGLKDYVPFFIRLREYVAKALPRPEDFIAGFAPMLAPPPDWARARLDSGLALVLVDGVDELPAERARQTDANSTTRDDVYEWLRDLVDVFPDARYVVTARPAAVSENWLNELSFAEASLEAMPPWLVETFVGHWHDAIRDQLADIDERRRLDSYERSLLTAIADDRNLSDLADTPLLAGLLCALNRHLRSQLPKRRSEIYERALAMFDQRDRARNIAVSRADLDLAAKTHLLADLALWMMRNGASEVDAGKATAQISRSLTQISASGQYDDRAVFRVLLERSGLLREPTAGRVDFVHRTFQEFLAAKAAVDADAMLELVRNSDDDQWGEVVVLAAGQANQSQAAELTRGLLKHKLRSRPTIRRRLLAVACLHEIRSLDPELRRDVQAIIPSLLPPKTMEQAKQLSTAGDTLIPPLAQHWSKDMKKANYTIRAASLVGGPAALNLIANVLSSLDPQRTAKVNDEILRAWQYFDPELYARQILSPGQYESFDIKDRRYLQAIRHMPLARQINVTVPAEESDLEALALLRRLEHLTLAPAPLQLAGLAGCPKLSTLRLLYYEGTDLLSLPGLPSLTTLILISSPLATVNGIERETGLTGITLDGCPRMGSIESLSSLMHLKKVNLVNCGEIDLVPLAGRTSLEIYYSGTTSVRHPEVLGEGSVARKVSTSASEYSAPQLEDLMEYFPRRPAYSKGAFPNLR